MRYCVALVLLIGMLTAPFSWAVPAQQLFTDWQVTCNNQNFCVTRNVGLHHGLVMTLSRSAGAHMDASLHIELGGLANPVASQPAIAPRLLLDGAPLKLEGEGWRVAPRLIATEDSAAINAFLQHILEGKAITLRNGLQAISLQGLKAALLFIDDQQKRVGSETAWISKGDHPPLSVPPAPALRAPGRNSPTPTPLSEKEYTDLIDFGSLRLNNSQCSLDPLRREVQVAALTDDRVLLMVSCEAGAYNTIYRGWLVSRQKPFVVRPLQLRLPFQPAGAETADIDLVNAGFDQNSRQLITLDKRRSLGDCGVQTRWRYDGERFRLVRYAGQPACDNWQTADAWPTLWITR